MTANNTASMLPPSAQVCLVGGAVRDRLLGLAVHERDWVVTGATPQAMVEAGFRPVGKDFPVFLHPVSNEEYALARTERKQGRGYYGFAVQSDPSVTLEQDLQRRDLTINAIAMDHDGQLIDPWGGCQDLEHRCLRHVSAAFSEDPLRLLRVARFTARFYHLGFRLHPSTETLLRHIVTSGELADMAVERIWQETRRAMGSAHPEVYLDLLAQLSALDQVFAPAIGERSRDQREKAIITLRAMTALTAEPILRLLAWLLAIDASEAQIIELATRLRWSRADRQLAQRARQAPSTPPNSAESIFEWFGRLDLWRNSATFEQHLLLNRVVLGWSFASIQRLRACAQAASAVRAADVAATGLRGPALGQAIDHARQEAVERVLKA